TPELGGGRHGHEVDRRRRADADRGAAGRGRVGDRARRAVRRRTEGDVARVRIRDRADILEARTRRQVADEKREGARDADARARAFDMSSATAAATLIGPPLVEALGVLVPPEPLPPDAPAALSACERSPATCPSTPPAGDEDEVPLALAVAEDEVVDAVFAV